MAGEGEPAIPSPENKLKLLCSFGGKILPRPSDKLLRYVGGETRLVAVPRSVSFAELRTKMASVFNAGGVSIRYQLASDDLDALVSVTCDEDVDHLLDEHDLAHHGHGHGHGHGRSSPSRVRVFLFPAAAPADLNRARSSPDLAPADAGSPADWRRRPPPLLLGGAPGRSPAGTPRGGGGACGWRGRVADPSSLTSPGRQPPRS
ncbi:uncharacterized protein LOC144705534 [Wolffia australiana]